MKKGLQHKFGLRCKELRAETGMSQEQFALTIGMDRSYYASIEVGDRNVSLSSIEKIAKGFNLPISQLFQDI